MKQKIIKVDEDFMEEYYVLEKKVDFIHQRLTKVIQEELKIALSREGFKDYLANMVKEYLSTHFSSLFQQVAQQTVNRTVQRLKYEHKITKDLCHSINDDVKQVIRELDCSPTTDEVIKNKIGSVIDHAASEVLIRIESDKNKVMNLIHDRT